MKPRFTAIAIAASIATGCGVLLLVLTLLVISGTPLPGDQELLRLAIGARSDILYAPIVAVTFVSSSVPALLIILTISAFEVRRMRRVRVARGGSFARRWSWLLGLWPAAAYLGTVATNILMRVTITRLPPQVPAITAVLPELRADFQRYAFPSGHAGAAVIVCLTLAIVAWDHRAWRWVAIVAAAVVVILAGFGRPYLGVHWPTDVLGGYLLAGFWLSVGLIIRNHADGVKKTP